MSSVLLIKNLQVARANMIDGVLMAFGPRMLAAQGFLDSLTFTQGHKTNQLKGFVYVHHDFRPKGRFKLDKSGNRKDFCPENRRGAYALGNRDYIGTNVPGLLGIQPTVEADIRISLMAVYQDEPNLSIIQSSLPLGRFGGGVIQDFKLSLHRDLYAAMEALRGGFVLCDRPDLMDAKDPIDSLIKVVTQKPKAQKDQVDGLPQVESWLVPFSNGYSLISQPAYKAGARDGKKHAFAENTYGIAQYVSMGMLDKPIEYCVWQARWDQHRSFILSQESYQSEEAEQPHLSA